MSKIGKSPITIPAGVTLEKTPGRITVTGPKGNISEVLPRGVDVEVKDGEANVTVKGKSKFDMSIHGTIRSLINNDVIGVTTGWTKKLELVGTGFRAETAGDTLTLIVGYSHPVKITAPEGVSFKIEKNVVEVSGIDKEKVGQVSADIRGVRPPEPYKGKGIKYSDEVIRRKAGKAAAKTTGAA